MDKTQFRDLLDKYVTDTISAEETKLLFQMLDMTEYQAELESYIDEHFTSTETEDINNPRLRNIVQARLQQAIRNNHEAPVIHLPVKRTSTWKRIAVAATIILMLGAGAYILFFNKSTKQDQIAKKPEVNDVEAPKGTKATITLANGKTVLLDSLTSGTLAVQGNVNVIKTADGQIIYNGSSKEVVYNTLFNPRGSKVVSLTLNDGSKVWLNSESSLRYPVAFAGNERKVEITGEAYFEVTKDAAKKFIVTGNGVTTEVLGTQFNINTYPDESSIKVTLIEGSVKVTKDASAGFLRPGQQAQVTSDIKVVSNVDADAVMAWKNGYFQFQESDIKTIMRQVARWYDVEVVYEGGVPAGHYNGKPSRDLNAAQMLKVVEYSGVKIRIEGKKIIVMDDPRPE